MYAQNDGKATRNFLNLIREKSAHYYVMALNQMYSYIFFLTLASPDFGKPKFWLAMILVGQVLEPTLSLYMELMVIACNEFNWNMEWTSKKTLQPHELIISLS